MKVFFDEDVPRKLARFLPQHEIHTFVSMEWGGVKNGAARRRRPRLPRGRLRRARDAAARADLSKPFGGVPAGIKELGPHLLGEDPLQLQKLNRRMDAAVKGHAYVKSGIDMACDLSTSDSAE